ncbi:MAG TPA: hypothetical protein VFD29_08570 [Gillisia sp.]|nr:hypothetical protein [Gillisia sp.]
MEIDPKYKMASTYYGVEKYILRKAFDTPEDSVLPQVLMWKKRTINVGIRYGWINSLVEHNFSRKRCSNGNRAC